MVLGQVVFLHERLADDCACHARQVCHGCALRRLGHDLPFRSACKCPCNFLRPLVLYADVVREPLREVVAVCVLLEELAKKLNLRGDIAVQFEFTQIRLSQPRYVLRLQNGIVEHTNKETVHFRRQGGQGGGRRTTSGCGCCGTDAN